MSLPKAFVNYFIFALLGGFLVASLSAPTLSAQEKFPGEGATTKNYKVVPLPESENQEKIAPIPLPSSSSAQIQEAGVFGTIVDKLGDFTECISSPGDCSKATAENLFEGVTYVIEHAFFLQIAGQRGSQALSYGAEAIAAGDFSIYQRYAADIRNNPGSPVDYGMIGLAGTTTNSLLALPLPVSTEQFVASIDPFKESYAQDVGTGQQELEEADVILEIWTNIRNAMYILAVVVLAIMGFMVMLRWKVDPRTQVTIQTALPRIVIALILITFSYAISGILIDLVRMVSRMVGAIVSINFEAGVFLDIIVSIIGAMVFILIRAGGTFIPGISSAPTSSIASLEGGSVQGVFFIAIIALLFFALLLAITILVIFIMLIFKLITRYVIFLLLTMFAPVFFLFGALPGAEGVITGWFRRALASLLAIPFTALAIELSFKIGFNGFQGFGDLPSMPGSVGLIGGSIEGALFWIFSAPFIGIGLFFFATKVPDIVDELMGIKPLAPRSGVGPGIIFAPVTGGLAGVQLGSNLLKGYSGIGSFANSYDPAINKHITGWRATLGKAARVVAGPADPKTGGSGGGGGGLGSP